ncbi:MAG: hypothetical protein AB1Z19_05170 [Eubacteriales bacterium]
MNTIIIMLVVTALLIVLPIGYVLLLKWKEFKDKKKNQILIAMAMVVVLVVVSALAINLYNFIINHDERLVAQRYVNSLVDHSIKGDEAAFLADVNTFAYEMDNADEVFDAAVDIAFTENPGLLISTSEAEDSEGNVYLYVLTQDLSFGLDVELKPAGAFYDVYEVTVLDEEKREELGAKEEFSPIW